MQLELGSITADVVQKNIKNVHLSVYPPAGQVRISAPLHMDMATIRVFALSKLSWIKAQQQQLQGQARETPREYLERESHYLWGERYLLKIKEIDTAPAITLKHRHIALQVRPDTTHEKKQALMSQWYRQQLKAVIPKLIAKWEPILNVKVATFYIQQMKTKWGSCSPHSHSIRLNTELAKKPPRCLEYVVVHEMVHLLEPTHNKRFTDLMNQYMPHWTHLKHELNSLPVRHEQWDY